MPLKRTITLPFLTLYGLGNILGAGIYVLVGEVAGKAGMLVPLSFLVASLLVVTTAFTYAELSSRYPVSAGVAVYLFKAFGQQKLSLLVGVMIAIAGTLSAATIVVGFAGYFGIFVELPFWLTVTLLLLLLGGLAIWGVQQSILVASLLTVTEIFGLLLIIWIGRDYLITLEQPLALFVPPTDFALWEGIFAGAFLAFFAFIGFEDMVNVAEEVVNPEKTMPKAIVLSLLVATTLYILISMISVLAVPPAELSQSSAPLAMIYQQTTGLSPILISLIGMFAVVNGTLIQMIMVSRILYGMSRQGWLPSLLGAVNRNTQTPIIATAVVAVMILVLALGFPIVALAEMSSLFVLIIFSLMHFSLLIIKRSEPRPEGVRCYPFWIPLVGFTSNVLFIATLLI